MIRYSRKGQIRVHQTREPQQPFWQTTTISPYSPEIRSTPIGIDFIRLRAVSRSTVDVSVPGVLHDIDFDRLPSPLLIEAHGPEEMIYRLGDKLLHELPADIRPMILLSADGDVPREISAVAPIVIVAAWPPDLVALESIAERAASEKHEWGVLVPVIYPVTTELESLRAIADTATRHGARFLAAASIETDARARRAVAELTEDLDEETWATLYDRNLEGIQIATERHVAALANDLGLDDAIDPWLGSSRSNRATAAFLARIGSRMVRMEHDVELGWMFLKASRTIATLDKELTRVASSAHVTIIPELADEIMAEVVEQWLESGNAEFAEHVDGKWRLKRE